MASLLIRTDMSTTIGTGHVMRTLALASAYQDSDPRTRITFLVRGLTSAFEQKLKEAGMECFFLDETISLADDLRRTKELLMATRADWVILDGLGFDSNYQKALRADDYSLLVIDDDARWPDYHAD